MSAASTKRLPYLPALDGFRALAVLLVMLSHVGVPGFPGGSLGVDLFFVLSGFLITTLLLEELDIADRINIPHFYARRLLRLYPALLLLLLLYAVFFHILRHVLRNEDIQSAKDIVLAGFYLTDYAVAFGVENRNSLLAHTWSLAVEEQFYLVWPFALPLLRRYFPGKKLVAALGTLFVLATLWRIACLSAQPWDRVYFRFDTRFSGLMLGALLAAILRSGLKMPFAASLLSLSGLAFLFCLVTMPSMPVGTYEITVGEIFGFFLLYQLLDGKSARLEEWLAHKIPVFFGRISYALYLFHFPVASLFLRADARWWIGFEVTLALAVGLAWFSWNTVEKAGRFKAKAYRLRAEARHVPKGT